MSGAESRDQASPPVGHTEGFRFALGVRAPLATVTLAYALSRMSDVLLYVGPLDRAAFGWSVVVPIWATSPVAAAFAWRRLTPRGTALAAVTLALIVGGAAAALLWSAAAYPNCQFGPIRTPIELVPPSIVVGLVIGLGLSAASLAATALVRRGHRWLATAIGAASAIALVFVATLAGTEVLGPACQRPPLT